MAKKSNQGYCELVLQKGTEKHWKSLGILKKHDLINSRRAQYTHLVFHQHPDQFPVTESSPQGVYSLKNKPYRKPRMRTNYGIQLQNFQIIEFLNNNEQVEELIKEFKSIKQFKKHFVELLLK